MTEPITADTVVSALEYLRIYDFGLDHSLRLDASQYQASHQIWATQLKGGKVIPFDWKNFPQIL